MCAVLSTRAQGLDDQYVQIYNQIQQADGYLKLGQKGQAAILYQEALVGLKRIKTMAPKWNDGVVSFRLDYVSEKLAELRHEPPPADTTAEAQPAPAVVDWAAQAASLAERVRALEAQRAELAAKLKEALELHPATADPAELQKARDTVEQLQKENDLLKAAVEQAKARPASSSKASAKEIDAALEKGRKEGKEKSKKEIATLESHLASANSEIDFLKKQISELSQKKSSGKGDKDIDRLRAELKVYEQNPVPLTAEERAWLQGVEPATAAAAPAPATSSAPAPGAGATAAAPAKPAKKAHYELPPGAGPLMADATRDFSARRFEQALKKFQQVLSQDENNLNVLYFVGACQIQLNQRDDANKTVAHALQVDATDEPALALLGTIRYQEDKYEEAFAALSRAVELDPKDASAQNLLGATLAQKGQTAAAETALRKALELQPEFGDAHYNLALIYLHEKPPFVHLARFHYRKALAQGHRPNVELEKLVGH